MAIAGFLLSAAACSDPLEPPFERVLATIQLPGQAPVIDVPDTAQAGQPFEVSIESYGNACREQGDTEVAGTSNAPVILPHDRALPTSACQDVLRTFEHRVSLTIPDAGNRSVVFRGISGATGDTLTLTRTVVVEE